MDLSEKLSFIFLLFQVVLSGVLGQTNKLIHHHNNGLSYGFYDQSCPQLETIVRGATQTFLLSDPTTAAALLRLMFHDCQVQGCDASILIDSFQSEMRSDKNFGVRQRGVINAIKSVVEAACPQRVSCADILVLAARDSVALSGGPLIDVPLGRRDSSNPPNYKLADSLLPPATAGVDATLRLFAQKGLTVEESVAIIGAHTMGATHCVNVRRRLFDSNAQRESKVPADLAALLSLNCPMGASSANISTVPNDRTSLTFDNRYYVNTVSGRGVLNIDAAMPTDPRTAGHVKRFAANEEEFFRAFSSAFVKLSSSNVLTGERGVIRRNCNTLY
nr:peroxidase 29 [Ipomoea batatas]GMD76542.1 peroxidase 29 [Ipomoea batatas]